MSTQQDHAEAKNETVTVSEKPTGLAITVYQSGAAVFRERRVIDLAEGRNQLLLAGLPQNLVRGSLTVTGVQYLGEHGDKVQFKYRPPSYRAANLSRLNILTGLIGQTITLYEQTSHSHQAVTGVLRNIIGNEALLDLDGTIHMLIPISAKMCFTLPDGLTDQASIQMEPTVSAAGTFAIKSRYASTGLVWAPAYEVFYDAQNKMLRRFACYANIQNGTGSKIEQSTFRLMVGQSPIREVQPSSRSMSKSRSFMPTAGIIQESMMEEPVAFAAAEMVFDAATSDQVGERPRFVLSEPMSLEANETKPDTIVYAGDVPVVPEYFLNCGSFCEVTCRDADLPRLPVNVRLLAKNDKRSKLGNGALPAGPVRVLEPDGAYDGEDTDWEDTDESMVVSAVAADEEFRLNLGRPCQSIKATRKLTFLHVDPEVKDKESTADDTSERGKDKKKPVLPRYREEEREVTLYNYTHEAVEVMVHESWYTDAWFISKSQEFAEFSRGAGTMIITVPAKVQTGEDTSAPGVATITYRLKYQINRISQ